MKKPSSKFNAFIVLSIITISLNQIEAQGCVAIRNGSATCSHEMNPGQGGEGWQFNTSYRYYKSFRHYRGKEEQVERVENGSDVRNYSNFLDMSLIRNFNNRWSLSVNLPFQSVRRTSLYEHDGKTRHETSAVGLGDVRFSVNAWLFKPSEKGNIQIGLGIKLPTGDYRYQYYLINPRDQNGTSTTRGGTASATAIKYRTATMSVPDQYMVRAGVNYSISKFTVSAGARLEGIPSEDLVGESNGFRRPGYVIALEPSISYQLNRFNIFAAVPIALERDRVQSDSDKRRTADTGTFTQGDAAFADYSINLGFSFRFGNSGM
ncbi:MAG: hypothetical protein IPL42_14980 [Saprospiraceae bacterium]|nr:hypothetical protein [Saprospiraceae bacterium]